MIVVRRLDWELRCSLALNGPVLEDITGSYFPGFNAFDGGPKVDIASSNDFAVGDDRDI